MSVISLVTALAVLRGGEAGGSKSSMSLKLWYVASDAAKLDR